MAAGMAKERSPKSLSTIKAMKTQTKAVKVNFFRTLEVNQRLKTTQRAFIQEILIVVRTLTFLTCPIPSPYPQSCVKLENQKPHP